MIDDLKFYSRLLLSRFPAMFVLFVAATAIGLAVALRAPTGYSTSAKLLVESAQISDGTREPETSAAEQLAVIQQRLMTRANLLDVARTNGVFPDIATMTPDDIVKGMRERTTISQTSGRDKATLMTIGFSGSRPDQVAAVVNQYVTIILDANTSFRTERAQSTLEFFQQEVDRLSRELDRQSADIVAFKNRNADALPETLDYRMNRQSLLQERLSRDERDLEALAKQRASVQRAYEANGALSSDALPLTPEQRQLQALEQQLNAALAVYAPQNPRVRVLQNQVDALRKRIAGQGAAGASSDDPRASVLDVTLAEIDSRAQTLKTEVTRTQADLEALVDSIERTPANRIALEAREREVANTQALYSAAVQRLNQARMGERIELSAKGERISVLEPASVPNTPSSPNRPKIIAMGVGVGLGLAGGLFVLLELLNQSIRRPQDIRARLDIIPLATLPRIETAAERRRRRILQISGMAAVTAAVPSLLWAVDTYYMPLDRLFTLIVAKMT